MSRDLQNAVPGRGAGIVELAQLDPVRRGDDRGQRAFSAQSQTGHYRRSSSENRLSQALVCCASVQPQRPTFSLAGAGSVLIGFTTACIRRGHADRLGGGSGRLRARIGRGRRSSRRSRRHCDQVSKRLTRLDRQCPRWTQPRHAPPVALPAIAGTAVIALALPVLPDHRLARSKAGVLRAVLWVGSEALGWFVRGSARGRVISPPQAWLDSSCSFARIAVMVVVFAVAPPNKWRRAGRRARLRGRLHARRSASRSSRTTPARRPERRRREGAALGVALTLALVAPPAAFAGDVRPGRSSSSSKTGSRSTSGRSTSRSPRPSSISAIGASVLDRCSASS